MLDTGEQDYLSVSEAAQRLGINVSTMHHRVAEKRFFGVIKTNSTTGCYRIPLTGVEEFDRDRQIS
jgi:hypothetical protein